MYNSDLHRTNHEGWSPWRFISSTSSVFRCFELSHVRFRAAVEAAKFSRLQPIRDYSSLRSRGNSFQLVGTSFYCRKLLPVTRKISSTRSETFRISRVDFLRLSRRRLSELGRGLSQLGQKMSFCSWPLLIGTIRWQCPSQVNSVKLLTIDKQ